MCVKLCAWAAARSQRRPTPRGHCLRKKRFFFFFLPWLDASEPEQRQHQRRSSWAAEVRLICLRQSLAFFPQRGWGGGGETECRAAGYQQQRELKQRFLINPENVESKSSAHVVKISQGWAATGMIASPQQGHHFLLPNTGARRTIISKNHLHWEENPTWSIAQDLNKELKDF